MQKYWGYHLILDCSNCESITSKSHIENYVAEIIHAINMIAHGDPQIEYLLEGTANEGYSVLQMITTSNLTAHFVTKQKSAYIDIFSCKEFDKDIAVSITKKYFSPKNISQTYLVRSA